MSRHISLEGEHSVTPQAWQADMREGAPVASRLLAGFVHRADLLLFAILFATALLPVLTTPIPAMVDYVNHLARMYVIAADGTPDASPYYYLSGSFYPNLAMDLVVPRLARLIGVEAATRMFLFITQILVVTGAIAIELAVKRRFQISGFVALLILYSVPFAWGFLNFEFALGLALWGIAAWLALRDRSWPTRLVAHALFVGVLFVSHLFALGLYGFTLGVHEAWAAWRRRAPARDIAGTLLMLAAPAVVAAGIMASLGGHVGQAVNEWGLFFKPFWLFMILNGYSTILSTAGMAILLVLLHALVKHRALRFEASGAWLLAGFALLYLAVPARLLDTAFVDIRVIVAAFLIVPAFVAVSFEDRRLQRVGAVVVIGLTLASTGLTETVWSSYQGDYRELITSFSRLGTGARVLVGASGAGADPPMDHLTDYPMYHAPTLAASYAKAFVPTLFTTVGKQPIAVRAPYRRLAYSCGGPVPLATLKAVADGSPLAETPDFVRSWPRDFGYVYLVGPPIANPMPDRLVEMERHARFTLYRVRTTGSQTSVRQ